VRIIHHAPVAPKIPVREAIFCSLFVFVKVLLALVGTGIVRFVENQDIALRIKVVEDDFVIGAAVTVWHATWGHGLFGSSARGFYHTVFRPEN
jgi:hypothetical protein